MMRPRRRDERGITSVTQAVIITPLLLFSILLIFQFGLAYHAKQVAQAAAQEGAATAKRFDGTAGAAENAARQILGTMSAELFADRSVEVQRGAETATVTVRGRIVQVVPGFRYRIEETASSPVERYVPPPGGGSP